MRHIYLAMLVLAALIGSLMAPPLAHAGGRKIIELELIAPKTYRWEGRDYDYAAIATALAEADAETPVRKLVLVTPNDGTTIADIIDFAMLAKPIGAKAYHKVNGRLNTISISIKN